MYEGFKEKKIDELTIFWKFDIDGFIIKMEYDGITFVEHQLMNKSNPAFPFSLNYEVKGIMSYKEKNNIPFLELCLDYPENITITLHSDEVPI